MDRYRGMSRKRLEDVLSMEVDEFESIQKRRQPKGLQVFLMMDVSSTKVKAVENYQSNNILKGLNHIRVI